MRESERVLEEELNQSSLTNSRKPQEKRFAEQPDLNIGQNRTEQNTENWLF